MDQTDALKGVVDKSGFPLQIAIAHLIKSGQRAHGWSVQYSEHAWRNDADGNSGFIDLVLENRSRTWVLVIECKRVLDASWIFLNPQQGISARRHAKVWASRFEDGNVTECGWADRTLDPAFVQSEFCAVFGQDSKSTPMLERLGATLISSTEALALEEQVTLLDESLPRRTYLNVVVTTAKLKVCSFDPCDIDLNSGIISQHSFTDVPFVRFRKQLSTRFPKSVTFQVGNSAEIVNAKENTVFVINSENLNTFIRDLEIDPQIA